MEDASRGNLWEIALLIRKRKSRSGSGRGGGESVRGRVRKGINEKKKIAGMPGHDNHKKKNQKTTQQKPPNKNKQKKKNKTKTNHNITKKNKSKKKWPGGGVGARGDRGS